MTHRYFAVYRSLVIVGVLALLAGFLFAPPLGAQQVGSIYCSQNVQYDASTTGSTRIFTANAASSARVYICGYTIQVGATATNVQFKFGTGTNCGTGTGNITPNFVLPIAGQIRDSSSVWRGLVSPAGNDVCIVASGANPVQAIVFYTYQQ